MKITILSSLACDSGCWLRAKYLADSLRPHCKVELIAPWPKSLPFMFEVVLSLPLNFLRIVFSRADFIIGMKPFPNVTIPLMFAKNFKKKKISVDIDDVDFGYNGRIISKVGCLLQKFAPHFFDVVTYHNENLKNYIITHFKVKETKLYKLDQGVDLKTFDSKMNNPEKNTLFYMGHLNIASDLDAILRAVKIIQTKKDVKFIVAGGGPHEYKFRELAKKLGVKARFTGYLPKEKIAEELANADICLVYYKEKEVNKYRCSMKLREYLAMGKKVVCNDFGDLESFSKYTYQSSSNIKDYAGKILEVLNKSDGREKIGEKYIKKNLDWNLLGKKYFKKIISLHFSP